MSADFVVSALATLLVTIDPVGLVPIFLASTRGMRSRERAQVAVLATIIAFAVLAFFALVGDTLLRLLGITLPAFQIAGGLLLFWTAFEMVFERRSDRKQDAVDTAITQDHIRNVAAFPLAIPLLAGPGAITATILMAGRADGEPAALVTLITLTALVMLVSLGVFLAASRIASLLSATGNIVLTRLLGIILAALAVQFVIAGTTAVMSPHLRCARALHQIVLCQAGPS